MSLFPCSSAARRLALAAVVLVAGYACLIATPAAAIGISYIYGIDDNNDIWELDPVGQTATNVFKTNLPGSANSNAFAYDNNRENMFFLNGTGTSSTLYVWNKPTNSLSVAATAGQLNIQSGSNQPGNAAYNPVDGGYYFFEDGTNDLYKITFSYSGAIPTFSNSQKLAVDNLYPAFSYGDIAIDPTMGANGILYGSSTTGDFFALDLSDVSSTYNFIGPNGLSPTTGLQLSFNVSYNTLYGHNFNTAAWYTIDSGDGTVSGPIWTSPVAFRDLGGASLTQAVVPEIDPTAFAGILAMVLGSLGLVERRRLAAIA